MHTTLDNCLSTLKRRSGKADRTEVVELEWKATLALNRTIGMALLRRRNLDLLAIFLQDVVEVAGQNYLSLKRRHHAGDQESGAPQ